MDNQRLIIWTLFSFMCILTYQAWNLDLQNKQENRQQLYQDNDVAPVVSSGLDNKLPAIQATGTIIKLMLLLVLKLQLKQLL